MKKQAILLAVVVLITMLTSCGYTQSDLEDARKDGYSDGYVNGYETGYDDGFEIGYDFCYEEYNDEMKYELECAQSLAREETGWSVYEAWNNILIYNDGIDPYGNDLPTDEEYRQSIETLVVFCEYLDREGLIN